MLSFIFVQLLIYQLDSTYIASFWDSLPSIFSILPSGILVFFFIPQSEVVSLSLLKYLISWSLSLLLLSLFPTELYHRLWITKILNQSIATRCIIQKYLTASYPAVIRKTKISVTLNTFFWIAGFDLLIFLYFNSFGF